MESSEYITIFSALIRNKPSFQIPTLFPVQIRFINSDTEILRPEADAWENRFDGDNTADPDFLFRN